MPDLSKFWSAPRQEKLFLVEALTLLLISHISVKILAFKWIHRFLHRYSSYRTDTSDRIDDIKLINKSVLRAAHRLPFRTLCLSRSIASFIMFRERGIPAVLCAGVKPDGSALLAHAWVRAGTGEIAGDPENTVFHIVMKIGQVPANL